LQKDLVLQLHDRINMQKSWELQDCHKADRSCTSCLCLKNGSNIGDNPASCVEIKQKKEDLELATPITLHFEEKRGEDKNGNNEASKKDGASQSSKSVNPGDEKTEVEELGGADKLIAKYISMVRLRNDFCESHCF
jgi:hypothetical protein